MLQTKNVTVVESGNAAVDLSNPSCDTKNSYL
jgi:hypothetical protein